jgi:putative ATP-dependent endonuclease of OLD family
MHISKISLVNYRNFQNTSLEFNKGINTIIGENGSGKTNLFQALRLMLDDDSFKYAFKLDSSDFNRSIGNWRGQWIIISVEFDEINFEESIQTLFVHGLGIVEDAFVKKASYNLFFRPKLNIRHKLSSLDENDKEGLEKVLSEITIEDYETVFTGKSTADFNDPEAYKELAGDFVNVRFNLDHDQAKFGAKIPHQLSISKDVCFTFIKALRDVVSDFQNNRTNPLLTLLKYKSTAINPAEYQPISDKIVDLNTSIENLKDVQEVRVNIQETIKEAVGETYSPSSLSIKSDLPSDAEKLLQSLKLYVGEPDENHEGAISELSLGGANLIFLTLKLLEFKYQKSKESFANFLLIEEPEAHLHTHIQKTLFDKINFEETQIIYSTHSTFISESSKIRSVNILSKAANIAEVFSPVKGLDEPNIDKLERYLDAVRSNLLFAKGIILVEGDAEQILIPLLCKKVLGVSLDELGISLINIGSTGFENVAQTFHEDRIKRNCAILTDFDKEICDTTIMPADDDKEKKYKTKVAASAKSGRERKVLLDALVDGNDYLQAFYANHTFEIDFMLENNVIEVGQTVNEVYKEQATRDKASDELEDAEIAISGRRILRMANHVGKGWYALILGKFINDQTLLPNYILNALVFAKSNINRNTILSIVNFRKARYLDNNRDADLDQLSVSIAAYEAGLKDLPDLIDEIDREMDSDQSIKFLKKLL